MSKPSEAKRRRREARKQAGWHPLAEWYRSTSGTIVPNETIATHQFALTRELTLEDLSEMRRSKIFDRGVITLPDDSMLRFVEQAGGSDHLAEALDEATRRCKTVVKLGE